MAMFSRTHRMVMSATPVKLRFTPYCSLFQSCTSGCHAVSTSNGSERSSSILLGFLRMDLMRLVHLPGCSDAEIA